MKKKVKNCMITTQAAKNKKMPHFMEHNIDKKLCAIKNVKSKLVDTVILCPAERVSRG